VIRPRDIVRCLGLIAPIASLGACTPIDWDPPADAEPSIGCGVDDPERTIVHQTIEVEGTTRSYTVRFPGSYHDDYPFPLVFMFHGAGATGGEFRELTALEEAARARAIFVYPTAMEDAQGVTRWDGDPAGPDFSLRAAIEDDLTERYCVDEARIFGVGFSNGAAFANEVACAGEVDGLGAVSGGGPVAPPCAGPVPAAIVHGSGDPVVDIEYGEQTRDAWGDENGCAETLTTTSPDPCLAYDDCDAPVLWCEHDDPVQIAHGWPKWTDEAIWSVLGAI
jgi:polyhydroxybutyrate depolymerase